jgi:hypothetical protein
VTASHVLLQALGPSILRDARIRHALEMLDLVLAGEHRIARGEQQRTCPIAFLPASCAASMIARQIFSSSFVYTLIASTPAFTSRSTSARASSGVLGVTLNGHTGGLPSKIGPHTYTRGRSVARKLVRRRSRDEASSPPRSRTVVTPLARNRASNSSEKSCTCASIRPGITLMPANSRLTSTPSGSLSVAARIFSMSAPRTTMCAGTTAPPRPSNNRTSART